MLISAAMLAGAAVAALAQAASPTTTITGRIASISGSSVTLAMSDNSSRTVTIDPGTLILSRQAATAADIRPGDALGVAARREPDGSLVATSINIFSPELWTVVRKGQWPMSDGQVMTNAQVTSLVSSVQGNTITMGYQGGTATITLPEGVLVHRLLTVKPAALQVGLAVAIRGAPGPDGGIVASSVSFDQAGG